MDQKVYDLINDQINKELYSAYLYLSFADYYAEEGLDGYANYYEIQAQEERGGQRLPHQEVPRLVHRRAAGGRGQR